MLKIKDNVDLKELEKYSFYKPLGNLKNVGYKNKDGLWILKSDRKIRITQSEKMTDIYDNTMSNSLYGLIKDGLVEKVED